ncbi:MAG: c-type cytochrome [Planctomycetales bacterium]|nr:c-type cytochrome [Planctomycetales bacterium]
MMRSFALMFVVFVTSNTLTWGQEADRHVPLAQGLEPLAAAERMTARDGFHVTLAAGEPQIHQPVAMAYDGRGRLWVAEAYTYPTRAPEGQGKDKIVILSDTNGDGQLDSREVFAEGLNLVSGLEVGFGGVWVGAAPYLMFLADADGDDRADGPPQILLDGFGFHDTHETLNAFIWGPDGWLYGCQGVFTHSNIGKPGAADSERTRMNAGVWRYHPVRHEFEVFSEGTSNPWGVDFNNEGQAFITACVIPHLYHVIQGARYQRQAGQHFNPHTYDDIKTIADHLHYAGNIRDHAWWGQDFVGVSDATSEAGGGHAHCGAMLYLGDNWPESYRNTLFVCNIHGNRVNNELLVPEGSGYVGKHGKDLVLANDAWFRGINLRYGPDGSVLMIDWYDKNACHRSDPEIWDRTNGRVYRITYGQAQPVDVDLGGMSSLELVEMHDHPNAWYPRMARRILQHRGADADVHRALWAKFNGGGDLPNRLRALWTLHVTGGISRNDEQRLLSDSNPTIRAWAIQLMVEDRQVDEQTVQRFANMARSDGSPRVRLYLASAVQRLPLEDRWDIVAGLVSHVEDADDHNLPLMVWYAAEPLVGADARRAFELAQSSQIPIVKRYIVRRAASDPSHLEALAERLAPGTSDTEMIIRQVHQALSSQADVPMPASWPAAYKQLVKHQDAGIRELADQVAVQLGDQAVFPRLRERVANRSESLARRQKALDVLVSGRDTKAATTLVTLLDDESIRASIVRALANFDAAEIPDALLKVYGSLSVDEKRDAIHTLSTRPRSVNKLLDAMEAGVVARGDVHAYDVRQIERYADDAMKTRLEKIWGTLRESSEDKKKQMADLKKELEPALKLADRSAGRAVFNKTCATCHTLFGFGEKVGPDLTGSNRANLDYILENVVDPSAVLGKDYRLTLFEMEDGRIVSGLVQLETDSAVTVRTVNDTVVLAKSQIDSRDVIEKSMMPDGLLEPLSSSERRDLIAYLGSGAQVAMRGPQSPIDPQTNKVPGALEGEEMEVLKRTGGAAKPQGMAGFADEVNRWSGASQLWWTGAQPQARLDLKLPVAKTGIYDLEFVATRARDYGVVQLYLDGAKVGEPIDLFHGPDVVTTGVLIVPAVELTAGDHKLSIQILGANPEADKSYMFGLDYVRLVTPQAEVQAGG